MKRATSLLLALALAAGLLTGCGAGSGGTTAAASPETYENGRDYAVSEESADAGLSGTEADRLSPNDGRKIIYNASLEMETEEFDATRDKLLEAASGAGAWVQSSDEGGSAENGSRWVRYTFRVPSDSYADFLNDAAAAGSVTYKSETTEDVTADYVDLEARLESLRTQEARLLELAQQAGDLADLLAIEEQLAQVRYEIESYTGQQRVYDSLLAYSTVDVSLNEVRLLTPVSNNFGSRAVTAFKESWHNFANGVQDVVIGFIYLLPVLLVLRSSCWRCSPSCARRAAAGPKSPSSRRPRPRRRPPAQRRQGRDPRPNTAPNSKNCQRQGMRRMPCFFCIVEIFAKKSYEKRQLRPGANRANNELTMGFVYNSGPVPPA